MNVVTVQAPYCEPGFPGGAAKIDRPSSESGQERGRGPCLLVSRLAGLGRASRAVRGLDGNDGRGEMSDTRELIERLMNTKLEVLPLDAEVDIERLARVCEELLKEHPERECQKVVNWHEKTCFDYGVVRPLAFWCQPCRDRALLERCDKEARGEA